jgi:hypothetical protein
MLLLSLDASGKGYDGDSSKLRIPTKLVVQRLKHLRHNSSCHHFPFSLMLLLSLDAFGKGDDGLAKAANSGYPQNLLLLWICMKLQLNLKSMKDLTESN